MKQKYRPTGTVGALLSVLILAGYASADSRVDTPLSGPCQASGPSCAKQALTAVVPETSELEWTLETQEQTSQRKFFRYSPVWNGIPVVGATAVVTSSTDGQPLFVDRPFAVLNVPKRAPLISADTAKELALAFVHQRSGGVIPVESRSVPKRVVLADGNVGQVVYDVQVGIPPAGVVHVFIAQDSGDVVWVKNPVIH